MRKKNKPKIKLSYNMYRLRIKIHKCIHGDKINKHFVKLSPKLIEKIYYNIKNYPKKLNHNQFNDYILNSHDELLFSDYKLYKKLAKLNTSFIYDLLKLDSMTILSLFCKSNIYDIDFDKIENILNKKKFSDKEYKTSNKYNDAIIFLYMNNIKIPPITLGDYESYHKLKFILTKEYDYKIKSSDLTLNNYLKYNEIKEYVINNHDKVKNYELIMYLHKFNIKSINIKQLKSEIFSNNNKKLINSKNEQIIQFLIDDDELNIKQVSKIIKCSISTLLYYIRKIVAYTKYYRRNKKISNKHLINIHFNYIKSLIYKKNMNYRNIFITHIDQLIKIFTSYKIIYLINNDGLLIINDLIDIYNIPIKFKQSKNTINYIINSLVFNNNEQLISQIIHKNIIDLTDDNISSLFLNSIIKNRNITNFSSIINELFNNNIMFSNKIINNIILNNHYSIRKIRHDRIIILLKEINKRNLIKYISKKAIYRVGDYELLIDYLNGLKLTLNESITANIINLGNYKLFNYIVKHNPQLCNNKLACKIKNINIIDYYHSKINLTLLNLYKKYKLPINKTILENIMFNMDIDMFNKYLSNSKIIPKKIYINEKNYIFDRFYHYRIKNGIEYKKNLVINYIADKISIKTSKVINNLHLGIKNPVDKHTYYYNDRLIPSCILYDIGLFKYDDIVDIDEYIDRISRISYIDDYYKTDRNLFPNIPFEMLSCQNIQTFIKHCSSFFFNIIEKGFNIWNIIHELDIKIWFNPSLYLQINCNTDIEIIMCILKHSNTLEHLEKTLILIEKEFNHSISYIISYDICHTYKSELLDNNDLFKMIDSKTISLINAILLKIISVDEIIENELILHMINFMCNILIKKSINVLSKDEIFSLKKLASIDNDIIDKLSFIKTNKIIS
jgi:hypothetical protein